MNPFEPPHFELTDEFRGLSKQFTDALFVFLKIGDGPEGVDTMFVIVKLGAKIIAHGVADDHHIDCGLQVCAFLTWHMMEVYSAANRPVHHWDKEDDSAASTLCELVVMLSREHYIRPITIERVRENFKEPSSSIKTPSMN